MDQHSRQVVMRRLRRTGASSEDAEDCAQEALLAAWQETSEGRSPTDLVAWMTTVARRRYVDLLRRESRRRTAHPAADELDRTSPTPEQHVIEREHARWLAGQLHELPDATRAVCSQAGSGAQRTEIAAQLGITARAAESHLTRARRFIRGKAALAWAAAVIPTVRWLRGHYIVGATTAGVVATAGSLLLLPTQGADAAAPVTPEVTNQQPVDEHHEQQPQPTPTTRPPARPREQPDGQISQPTPLPPAPTPRRPRVAQLPASPQLPPPQRPAILRTIPLDPSRIRHQISDVSSEVTSGSAAIDPCPLATDEC